MAKTQDTPKTLSNGSNGTRSPLNDGGYILATEIVAKLQSDLEQIKDLQPLPRRMTLSWKFPKKPSGDIYAQLQFKFWQPDGTDFKQHAVGLGKVTWGTYLQLVDKLRMLHAKLQQYHPSEYRADKVAEFWQWADIDLRGKSDVALSEQSPLFTEVVKWLQTAKKKLQDISWKKYEKYLPKVADKATLEDAIIELPNILTNANSKNSRRDARACWRAIAELPQLVDSGESQKIFKILKKFPKITESKCGYERNDYVPNTRDILKVYQIGCSPNRYLEGTVVTRTVYGKTITYSRKSLKSYNLGLRHQWAFLVLATYGIRIHELFAIANWTTPVTLKSGDWIGLVGEDKLGEDDEGKDDIEQFEQLSADQIIPAWNDPTIPNEARVLAIKANTKTGFRLAVPLSPIGDNWVQLLLDTICGEFHPVYGGCPIWENDTAAQSFATYVSTTPSPENYAVKVNQQRILWDEVFGDNWSKYKFSAHKLRHSWNHRAHAQGLPVELIAKSLGHRIATNLSTYFKNKSDEVEMAIMQNAANGLINVIKKQQSPTISLERAMAIGSSIMDESGKVDLATILSVIYGLKADQLLINR